MKHYLPEISWHSRDAIYSVDFQNDFQCYRFVTAGIEKNIRLWRITFDEGKSSGGSPKVEFLASLSSHQGTVNVVRFSTAECLLASGDVEGVIIIWQKTDSVAPDIFAPEDELPNQENWAVFKRLRSHVDDVCDLCWSPSGKQIASVSVDKSVIVWNVETGSAMKILKDIRMFPNGVCWDPRNDFFVTLGNDREMHIYSNSVTVSKLKRVKRVSKARLSFLGEKENQLDKEFKLFHDDSLMSFVRRPSFSPNGELLITPAGCLEDGDRLLNTTYVFTRTDLHRPALVLPCPDKPTVAVSCCPVLFQLHPDVDNLFELPYRVVFGVLSTEALLLYHTQQTTPFACVTDVHYCNLTDLAWSSDGLLLLVSSIDGYCSFVRFAPGELGDPLKQPPELPPLVPVTPLKPPKNKTPKSGVVIGQPEQKSAKAPTTPIAAPRKPSPTSKTPKIMQFFDKSRKEQGERKTNSPDDEIAVVYESKPVVSNRVGPPKPVTPKSEPVAADLKKLVPVAEVTPKTKLHNKEAKSAVTPSHKPSVDSVTPGSKRQHMPTSLSTDKTAKSDPAAKAPSEINTFTQITKHTPEIKEEKPIVHNALTKDEDGNDDSNGSGSRLTDLKEQNGLMEKQVRKTPNEQLKQITLDTWHSPRAPAETTAARKKAPRRVNFVTLTDEPPPKRPAAVDAAPPTHTGEETSAREDSGDLQCEAVVQTQISNETLPDENLPKPSEVVKRPRRVSFLTLFS